MIKFGTDGWRAIIGEDFTKENVSKLIQAFCNLEKNSKNKLVFVGYDRRAQSDTMAHLAAQILASNGFDVKLSRQFCPTPCISWLVKENSALAGIMITASHNPAEWNGVKIKQSQGGSAPVSYTKKIEEEILRVGDIVCEPFDKLLAQKSIHFFDPNDTYVKHLKNFIDVKKIRQSNFKVVADPLYGAGTDFFKKVLEQDVVQIHDAADTNFGGLNPEPIENNLAHLREAVLKNSADIGLATDGDADRIGAFDEKGNFINSHQIFGLLLLHNLRHRKLTGSIVRSVSTSQLIDRICKKEGLQLIETPIGFKYIGEKLIELNALMGGEESGGISLREHVHERDGIFNGLSLLEMMAVQGKSLSQLIEDMDDEFGKFYFERQDFHLTDEKINEIRQKLAKQDIKKIGDVSLTCYNLLDGCKMCFSDVSWLLVRASGTEPLLRVYAEAFTLKRVRELLNFVTRDFIGKI